MEGDMGNNKLTAPLYKILLLYEDVFEPTSSVTENDYLTYLDRISAYYLGASQMDIYRYIRGLRSAGINPQLSPSCFISAVL